MRKYGKTKPKQKKGLMIGIMIGRPVGVKKNKKMSPMEMRSKTIIKSRKRK